MADTTSNAIEKRSGMLFSVAVMLSGEIPVIRPKIIYDGRKAKALSRRGKCSNLANTNAGIIHRSVPNMALIHAPEDVADEADVPEAT